MAETFDLRRCRGHVLAVTIQVIAVFHNSMIYSYISSVRFFIYSFIGARKMHRTHKIDI